MSREVWLEWQAKWRDDPWSEERADLRNGIAAHSIYQAIYGAVNRVIQAIAGGTDDFDYENLPGVTAFMPYYRKRRGEGGEDEDDEAGDGRPLDPNTMTEEEWARHALEVSRWREYLSVRAASQGAAAPGTVPEAAIR
jgi:hypothetical protein